MSKGVMEIKERKISELIHAEYNPRQLKKDQHQQLKDSLLRFGVVDPVIVNVHPDRKDIIVGGHQRTKVWESMGNTTIQTVEVELTLEQERELNVRLNKNTGEFDFDMLANHFDVDELKEWGFDEKELSFDTDEEAEEDDFEVPDEVKTDVVLGDLIEIGEHRLLCGDSTDSDQVAKLMDGEKADMVFTDPPYGMSFQSNFREKTPQFSKIENDDKILDIAPILYLHIKDNAAAYVCTRWDLYPIWYNQMADSFDIKNCIVWYKKGGGLGDLVNSYAPNHEFIIVGHKGKSELKGKREADVWEIGRDGFNDYKHPTQKPVELSSFAIKNHSVDNNLILDLFLGSGSTMVAAEQLNRKCYGMELDPKYCQVIMDRMIKLNPDICVKINGKDYGITN